MPHTASAAGRFSSGFEQTWKDTRYGLRALLKTPGFSAVAMLTLALGIGGSTAMFSLLYHIVLKPLAYPDAGRLAEVRSLTPQSARASTSMPDYLDLRAQTQTFAQLAAFARRTENVTSPGPPESIAAAEVSDNFFQTAGVRPLLGRGIDASDDRVDGVVISHALWQSRFGGTPDIVGRAIVLDRSRTVVGVMPPGFDLPSGAELWVPFGVKARTQPRRADFLTVIGRLRPTATLQQADSEMRTIVARLASAYPESNGGRGVEVHGWQASLVRVTRTPLITLFASVSLLLLIACGNIALLMLARGAGRRQEIVTRAALGASRVRLLTQWLIESLLLGAAGAALGMTLAYASLRTAQRWSAFSALPRMQDVTIDGVVLLFAIVTALLCTLLFSLLPLRHVAQIDLSTALRARGPAGSPRLMRGLVCAQAMLATLLVVGAGLLVRSLDALMRVDPGYRSEGVLTAKISLPDTTYRDSTAIAQFHERLIERLRATPGVLSVALATAPPAMGGNEQLITLQGYVPKPGSESVSDLRGVTEDYLRVTGIALVSGRDFSADDGPATPLVALVNETFVRRYFDDGRNPIGARVAIDGPEWRTIVGIFADTHQDGVDLPPQPEVLVPIAQRRTRGPVVLLKTMQAPASMVAAVRAAVNGIDAQLPIGRIATLTELRDAALQQPAFRTTLLAAFAATALLLVSLGIYGMTSYSVSRRAPEFGLRMALGATRGSIAALVLGSASRLALLGGIGGVLAAAAAARAIASLLFRIDAYDPLAFIAAPLLVLLVCVASAILPARRATRVDPMTTLRAE